MVTSQIFSPENLLATPARGPSRRRTSLRLAQKHKVPRRRDVSVFCAQDLILTGSVHLSYFLSLDRLGIENLLKVFKSSREQSSLLASCAQISRTQFVRRRGFEPPSPCGRYHLKVVRLPISPPARPVDYAEKKPVFQGLRTKRPFEQRVLLRYLGSFLCRLLLNHHLFGNHNITNVAHLPLDLPIGLMANEVQFRTAHLCATN